MKFQRIFDYACAVACVIIAALIWHASIVELGG